MADGIEQLIPQIQHFLEGMPVEKAWLFGSFSRGEGRPDSDVDILVRYSRDAPMSLFAISKMMVQMKRLLGREVDLVEEDCLQPFVRDTVNRDKVLIYERTS